MTADDRSLFFTLGSVTLLLASQRSERLEMPASLCVCVQKQHILQVNNCVCTMHVLFWRDVMRTHVEISSAVRSLQCGLLELKGSLKRVDASDTRCSLWWERRPLCIFSCCDQPFIYPLNHSLVLPFVSVSELPFFSSHHTFYSLFQRPSCHFFPSHTRSALSKYSKLIRGDRARRSC